MNVKVVFHERTGVLGIERNVNSKDWTSNYAVFILDPVTLQETGEKQYTNQPWKELPADDPRVVFVKLFSIFEDGFADWNISHSYEQCEVMEMYIGNRAQVFEIFRKKILNETIKGISEKLGATIKTLKKQLEIDGESILDLEAVVKGYETHIEKLDADSKEPDKAALLLNLNYVDGFIMKLPIGLGEETLKWAIYAVKQYVKYNKIPGGPIDPNAWAWEKFKASFKPAEKKVDDASGFLPP